MYRLALLVLVAVASAVELGTPPKFAAFGPSRLTVRLPRYEGLQLVLFRMSVRDDRNFEYGVNDVDGPVEIYDEKLNLRRGDVVNYLIGFRDGAGGYQAQVGKYDFDGEYKDVVKRFLYRHLTKRSAVTQNEPNGDDGGDVAEESGENVSLTQSRFGGGGHFNRHGYPRGPGGNGFGPGHGHPYNYPHPPHGYEPFGPGFVHNHPPFPNGPPYFQPFPNQGPHHGSFNGFHHGSGNCHHDHKNGIDAGSKPPETATTTTTTTTTTEYPDIDIRFSKD